MLDTKGLRIFFDRYAVKASEEADVGSMVVFTKPGNNGVSSREVGRVLEKENGHVTIGLVDVRENEVLAASDDPDPTTVPSTHADKLEETTTIRMIKRVAGAAAAVEAEENQEKWFKEFTSIMENWDFVPGGRILSGLGTDSINTAYNCYVLPAPKDSRKGINDTLYMMTEIMCRGGGVGIPVMSLRPKGDHVKTVNGRSSGSVNWAEDFDSRTGKVNQGGSRRGALMLVHYCWHPDVLDFIVAKQREGAFSNSNLSVAITQKFLDAVRDDENWELVFPNTRFERYDEEWDGDIEAWKERGYPVRVWNTVKARDLWSLIIKSAHRSAEPGLIFIDRYNNEANSAYYPEGKIFACNPCFTGDTRIATQFGLVPISGLASRKVDLRVTTDSRVEENLKVGDSLGTAVRDAVPAFCTSKVPIEVFRLETRSGYSVTTTSYHKFVTPTGFVKLQDLEVGDQILLQSGEGQWGQDGSAELGAVMGWIAGDGWWSEGSVVFRFYGEKKEIAADLLPLARKLLPDNRTLNEYTTGSVDASEASSVPLSRILREYGFDAATRGRVPEVVWRGCRLMVRNYLRYLFAADGCVNFSKEKRSCSARYNQSRPDLLRDVQTLLQNFGIVSKLYKRRDAGWRRLPNGKGDYADYWCKENYELVISKQNLLLFADVVGFVRTKHTEMYSSWKDTCVRGPYREKYVDEIVSIERVGEELVYCTTQRSHHTVIANGIVTGQCGEQGLPGWGVCNLGSLNLANFHNEGNGLDTKRLVRTTKAAVRFLDNVIDATAYITPQMEKQQKMERRVGLGTMGLGELLILKGMKYGSEESLAFIDELFELIAKSAYEASIEIAEEKGKFPKHDARFNERPFVQQVCGEGKLHGMLDQNGIRNVTLLTQAPTGTIGTMVGTSTGIEPYPWFVWEYKSEMGMLKEAARPLKQWLVDNNHCAEDTLTDFIRRGGLDKLKEEGDLPEYFVTAHDLEPEDHARVQATIQRWTDASISKTSNLPEHYTVDQVGKFYQLLHDLGCKGGTVYREGSREAVIHRVTKDEEKNPEDEKPSWDLKPLPGDGEVIPELRVGTQTPFGRVTTKLSMVDDVPFDLYQTIGHTGTDIMADQEAIGRLMSLVLRINSPVPPERRLEMIIDQLANIGGRAQIGFGKKSFSSIPDVIANNVDRLRQAFLRRCHEDGGKCGCGIGKAKAHEQKSHLDICPECGNASLHGSKCVKCVHCGYESC